MAPQKTNDRSTFAHFCEKCTVQAKRFLALCASFLYNMVFTQGYAMLFRSMYQIVGSLLVTFALLSTTAHAETEVCDTDAHNGPQLSSIAGPKASSMSLDQGMQNTLGFALNLSIIDGWAQEQRPAITSALQKSGIVACILLTFSLLGRTNRRRTNTDDTRLLKAICN